MHTYEIKGASFFLLILGIFLSGCANTYYIPQSHHVPLFEEEGEISASGKAAAGIYHTGLDIQFAQSTSNSNAFMANAGFNLTGEGDTGMHLRGGLGKYRKLNRFVVMEAYGGISYGTLKNTHNGPFEEVLDDEGNYTVVPNPIPERTSRVHHGGLWLQPQIGFTTRFFDIALVSGFQYQNFFAVRQSGPLEISEQQELFHLRSNKGNFFWEPGIVIRLGWDYVKAELQYMGSVVINNPSLPYEPLRVSLGLTMKMPPRKAPSKTKDL
jgi:hypothetical protein